MSLSIVLLFALAPTAALADQVFQLSGPGGGGLGLDIGVACDVGTGVACQLDSAVSNYQLKAPNTAAASGTLVMNDGLTSLVSLTLDVPTASLFLNPGGTQLGSVDEIALSSLSITFNPGGFDLDPSATGINLLGLSAGVSGTYTQQSGGSPVVGSQPITASNVVASVVCELAGGQCGISLGSTGNLQLGAVGDAGTAAQELNLTFNLVVPEPGTALLVMVGLAGLALRRR